VIYHHNRSVCAICGGAVFAIFSAIFSAFITAFMLLPLLSPAAVNAKLLLKSVVDWRIAHRAIVCVQSEVDDLIRSLPADIILFALNHL
jgi:hypothetical protein